MTEQEKAVAKRLIEKLLAENVPITIACEGEIDCKQSTDFAEIYDAATACAYTELTACGRGWFLLVYGNASDGSELIADYADNEFCNRIYSEVYPDGTD